MAKIVQRHDSPNITKIEVFFIKSCRYAKSTKFVFVRKLSLFLSLAICSVVLGLTLPENPFGGPRDQVPPSQKVAHSNHCSGCHGVDEEGLAMVDYDGNDVSIFDDWQISMMGFSSRDPFWRATMEHDTNLFPSAAAAIETTCLK